MDDADRARVVMLLDSGQAQEAVDLLGPMLAAAPDDSALLILQARALVALARYTDAMASAKRASELSPYADEPHRIASVILGKVGDLEGSARAAREAVRLSPGEPAAWEQVCYAVGRLLADLGSSGDRAVLGRIREVSEEVLVAADRVVALAPTESSAYVARGYALTCARRPGPAHEAYERARALDPDAAAAGLVPPSPGGFRGRSGLGRAQLVLMLLLAVVLAVGVAIAMSH